MMTLGLVDAVIIYNFFFTCSPISPVGFPLWRGDRTRPIIAQAILQWRHLFFAEPYLKAIKHHKTSRRLVRNLKHSDATRNISREPQYSLQGIQNGKESVNTTLFFCHFRF